MNKTLIRLFIAWVQIVTELLSEQALAPSTRRRLENVAEALCDELDRGL